MTNSRNAVILSLMTVTLLVSGSSLVYNYLMANELDAVKFTPLLNTIAKGESGGNYNAYYGNSANTSLKLTDMSVQEVLAWQQEYIDQGHASSAVGKYQIIRPTLIGLARSMRIDPTEKFRPTMQDRMAVALLRKRGVVEFMHGQLSSKQFAANLAQEWAALPKVTGADAGQSYYEGDGINKVRISLREILHDLALIQRP